jgi:hypothetical protein
MLLIAAAAAVLIGVTGSGDAEAAASPQVSSIDCAVHPAQFDVIYITNGADAYDLAGWTLRSDPEGSEQMSLAAAGSLDPGEQLIVVAGAHGVTIPTENVYLWTNAEILRDAGEPADYVKLYDPAGAFVSGMDCTGAVLTSAPPAPAPTQAPAQNPTTTQPTTQPAAAGPRQAAAPKSVPNSGGEPAGDGGPGEVTLVGLLAVLGGAAIMISGIRGERIAARITSAEGERPAGPRGAQTGPQGPVRGQSGREDSGRS